MFDKLAKVIFGDKELELQKAAELDAEKQRKREDAKAKRAAKKAAKLSEASKVKSEKELATERGDPWVNVLGIEIDPDDPGAGAFELDWNDKFVANLIRAGYQGKADADIVDNWFQDICRHVVMETYAQEQADPEKRKRANNNKRDLGNGRTEVS